MKFVVSLVCGRNITTKDCIDIVSRYENDVKIANIPEISDFYAKVTHFECLLFRKNV